MTATEILAMLTVKRIDISQWGRGEAKDFDSLVREIQNGECQLARDNGSVLRLANGVTIDVYYTGTTGQKQVLVEERQVFHDGRTRHRHPVTSLGEKLRRGEDELEGAYRALREELGIDERLPLRRISYHIKGPHPSRSYPGLQSVFRTTHFVVDLPEHWYQPAGYIEIQSDKRSYFVWQRISDP